MALRDLCGYLLYLMRPFANEKALGSLWWSQEKTPLRWRWPVRAKTPNASDCKMHFKKQILDQVNDTENKMYLLYYS